MKKSYLFLLSTLFLVFFLSGCDKKNEDVFTIGDASSTSLSGEYIFNATGLKSASSTIEADTDVASSTAHGLKTGDRIVLSTLGTLPTPLETDTIYYPINITTDSFEFSTYPTGSKINITANGSTTVWTIHDTGRPVFMENFRNAVLSYDTDGGGDAAMTVKFQGSVQGTVPDFSAAQSVTNQWDYIEVVDLEDGSAIDGDTGVAVAGADDHRLFEMNVEHLRWANAIMSGYTEGELTLKIKLKDNN